MEFQRLTVLAFFCLVIVGTDASQSAEDYWQSVRPNSPLPKALSDLLLPYSGNNLPIKPEEEKQYWTVFFEHDLHPGKKMRLGETRKPSGTSQPFGQRSWEETGKPSRTSQPFGQRSWEETGKPSGTSQPFGQRSWEETSKPSGTSQPFGQRSWEETSKPFGQRSWERHSHNNFCEGQGAIGEDRYCATSLESMMDFAISKLGKNIKLISSSFAQNQDQYMVEEVKKIADNMVMCHRMNYENLLFYCHQVNATTSYMVPLVASDGTKAKALTICHHDTRGMDPDVLYHVLGVKPGTIPVCHFVGNKAIAWVPNSTGGESDHPCVI